MTYCVVLVTVPRGRQAQRLARLLVDKKLCACVNLIDRLKSFFWWQGKLETGRESLLIIKTKKSLLTRLVKAVKAAHSYSVPEVIALPVIGGNRDYLDWVAASCRKG